MKKTVVVIVGLLFVAAAVSMPAFASNWGKGPGCDEGRGLGPGGIGDFRGAAGLNLTPEQTAKLSEIRKEQEKDLTSIREQMLAKRNALKRLWLEPTPDREKIAAAQKDLGALRDQMIDKVTVHRLESLKVLTPAQQEIAKARFADRGAFNRGSMMNGGNRGGAGRFGFGPACPRQN